jgi:hypothetical protein
VEILARVIWIREQLEDGNVAEALAALADLEMELAA